MNEERDTSHTNEFGEIEVLRDTKYWFKKDAQTIKKSLIATLKISPAILATVFVFALATIRYVSAQIELSTAFFYTLVLFPVFLLGYLMLHVMATKGYNIDPYAGTHIDTAKYKKRFSASYILESQMPISRKILYLLRLLVYFLLVMGLLLHILISFGE